MKVSVVCPKCGHENQINTYCRSCKAKLEIFPPFVSSKPDINLVSEFINALDKEIETADKHRSKYRIFDGKLIRKEAGISIYLFKLESPLTAFDDTPVHVIIKDMKYIGNIIQNKELEIIIGIEDDLGKHIPKAYLVVNTSFLYKKLKNIFTNLINDNFNNLTIGNFQLSNLIFKNKYGWKSNTKVVVDIPELNESQKRAIEKAQSRQVTILWGPPGTGKTKTLAYMVHCFVERGMDVLVVAHSNAAVDELAEKIADIMKDSEYYKRGQIVRFGVYGEKLKDKFICFEKIVAKFSEDLNKELEELKYRKNKIEQRIKDLKELLEKEDFERFVIERNKLKDRLIQLQFELDRESRYNSKLKSDIAQKELLITNLHAKLQQAESMNRLIRIILGMNPDKIRARISREQTKLEELKKCLEECEKKRKELKTDIDLIKSELKTIESNINRLLGIKKEFEKLHKELEIMCSKIEVIEERLKNLRKDVLEKAKVLCTTLTKTFSDREFPNKLFDVLIVDEGSMAPLPYLYWVLSKCRGFVVIAGDFLQLPPICLSNENIAKKWFKRNIFSLLGIDDVDLAKNDDRVCLLDTQYRMNPRISKITNELFYKGILRDYENVKENVIEDKISSNPLTLIDTSSASPWCKLDRYSRINFYTALLSIELAERIIRSARCSIAIISPFKAQVRLINKILRERGLQNVAVGTVHRFQGGEADVVIFDTVESFGVRTTSKLLDDSKDKIANLLINVALTRARCKILLIANTRYFEEKYPQDSKILKIIQIFKKEGEIINSERFVNYYIVSESFIEDSLKSKLYRENQFYRVFCRDLVNAKKKVIIVSPFVTWKRLKEFVKIFKVLSDKGVEIKIYIRPIDELAYRYNQNLKKAFEKLKNQMKIEIIEKKNIHYKVAIIDDYILWEGSLNILSHSGTEEIMRRFESKHIVEEVLRLLNIQ